MRSLLICTAHRILLGDKIEKSKMDWACAAFGEEGSLVGRPEGKKPFERHRRRWEDNVQMDNIILSVLSGCGNWSFFM